MIIGSVLKTAFDNYTLGEQIGSGGNGRVFSAINGNGEAVAVKLVNRNISSNKLRRFKNEIHFCENHKHKNIAEILDHGYAVLNGEEYVFYVMPLYFETLRAKMKVGINPEDAVNIFIGLIEGLSYAHKHGTIRRDIKPENILFKSNSLEPIICDFGIAHFSKDELLTDVETKIGDRMANFQYSAPEQRIKGGVAVAQTDIYAAGLILNEMFTGEIPQAKDYKTISSVSSDYAYLDEVFDQIFKQNADDRLYPKNKIFTEMKVQAEKHHRKQEIEKLQNVVSETVNVEKFEMHVTAKEYRSGNIVFIMDKEVPKEWFDIMRFGSYTHTSLRNYETIYLKKGKNNEICMPVRGNESTDTVKSIVTYVSEWIISVNKEYTNHLKISAQKEQESKEAERKAAIEKLEKDNELALLIASL